MRWKKQDFNYALNKLLGKYEIVKKITAKDKHKIKEEFDVKIERNPWMKGWDNVEILMEQNMKGFGFEVLKKMRK